MEDARLAALLSQLFEGGAEAATVALCVFARVGAALFLVPGLGERAIPMRVRLVAALALTWLLLPIVAGLLPAAPATPAALARTLVGEAAAGLLIGLCFRLLVMALQVAGAVAAQSISISHIFGTGVAYEAEPSIATLLAMGGIAIALSAGLHVHLVAALAGLYDVLPFGALPAGPDLAEWSARQTAEVFALGISLALPFVAISLVYNLALAALSRAMPQLLFTLVGVPMLVALGLGTLWLALPEIFTRWLDTAGGVFADPLGGLG